MNIQSEIREYIFSRDFVMLPGIGAFVAEYSQPYFDQHGEIVPAERKIRFNPLLRNDSDVDILKVFRDRMNISDEEVQEQYFTFLDSVNEQLATFHRYYWEGFGILLKETADADLQFLPFRPSGDAAVEKSAVTGEKTIVVPDSPAEAMNPETIPGAESKSNDAAVFGAMDGRERVVMSGQEAGSETETVEPVEESGGSKPLKYLLFAIPLALLSAALAYMVFIKPSQRNSVQQEAISLASDLDSGEVTIDTLYIEDTPAVPAPEEEHIVRIGIYKRTKDADKIVAFLSTKGYDARIRPHGPLYKVYLVAETEEGALRYIREVARLIDDTPIYERKKRNG